MALILLTLLALCGSLASGADWNREVERARTLCDQNDFEKAKTLYEDVLTQRGTEDVFRATTLNDFGYCCHRAGRLLDAEQLYRRSLQALEQLPSASSQAQMQVASNLTRLYIETGRLSRAEGLLERLLPAERLEAENPGTAVLLSDLAFVRIGQQRIEEAERLLSDAIAALEPEPGFTEHAVIAMSNLSGLYAQTAACPRRVLIRIEPWVCSRRPAIAHRPRP